MDIIVLNEPMEREKKKERGLCMEIGLSVFGETETLTLKRRRKMIFLSVVLQQMPRRMGK